MNVPIILTPCKERREMYCPPPIQNKPVRYSTPEKGRQLFPETPSQKEKEKLTCPNAPIRNISSKKNNVQVVIPFPNI